MSTTSIETPKRAKTVTTPAFTVGRVVKATVPVQRLHLEPLQHGGYSVYVQDRPCHRVKLGTIRKSGTGWAAEFRSGMPNAGGTAPFLRSESFDGDRYPTRTGKRTQTYALVFLLACELGLSANAATYDVQYDGVSA